MGHNAQAGQSHRECINEQEENLDANDAIYKLGQQLLRKDRVFFDEFGEIVQSGSFTA